MLLFRQHQVDPGMIFVSLSFLTAHILSAGKILPATKKPRPKARLFQQNNAAFSFTFHVFRADRLCHHRQHGRPRGFRRQETVRNGDWRKTLPRVWPE